MNNDYGPARLCILLVDDHLIGARALSRLLGMNGHHVHVAHSVAQALKIAEQHHCELLITDISLPDGDGIDLFRQLNATRRIPAIALSGHGSEAYGRECERAGFSSYLIKPVRLSEMLAAIEAVPPPPNSKSRTAEFQC